ncbi:MAG TPA: PAS domain S-box protein [Gemmatimonadaceae bacterium]
MAAGSRTDGAADGERHQTALRFRGAAKLSAAATALVALGGLLGFLSGFRVLGSIRPDFIPMAPSTAACFLILSAGLYLSAREHETGPGRTAIVAPVLLVAVFGLLDVVGSLTGLDLTREAWLTRNAGSLGGVPLARMSPMSATGFVFAGVATLLIWLRPASSRQAERFGDWASSLGVLVAVLGATILLAYVFGKPLLYGGVTVPMAATTSVGFVLIGVASAAAAGPHRFPVRLMVGDSPSARMMRVFLPLAVSALLIGGMLSQVLVTAATGKDAVLLAAMIVAWGVLTAYAVARESRELGANLEARSVLLQESEQFLREAQHAARIGSYRADFVTDQWQSSEVLDQIFGIDAAYVRTVPGWLGLIHPDDRPMMERYLHEEVVAKGRAFDRQYRIVRKDDGTTRWVHGFGALAVDPAGAVIGLTGTIQDITERRQAEESLRASAERHHTVIQTAMDGYGRAGADGRLLEVNDALCRMSGYSESELLALRILDLEAAESADQTSARIRAMMARGEGRFETRHRRKDGSVYDVEISVKVQAADGGHMVFLRDITQRKREELEREVMHEIAQSVATSANLDQLLVFMHHSFQRVLDAENCFVALLDPVTGLFGFPYFVDQRDAVPHNPVEMSKSCTAYVFRRGEPLLLLPGVLRRLHEDGEVERVGSPSASWMGVPLQTPSRTIGVLVLQHYERENVYTERDLAFLAAVGNQVAVVIERKLAEESLRLTVWRLREAQRMAGMGSWELDLASGAVSWSKSFERLVRHDPDLPAPSLGDMPRYFTPESWERLGAAIQVATVAGAGFELDLEGLREDGEHWRLTARGEAVRSPAGDIVGLQGTVLDISVRHRAEAAAAVFESQLQQAQKMETVGRLAGGIAHDFNNMLGVILGHAELAMLQLDASQPLYGDLSEIHKAAKRSADLTRSLLAYARKQKIMPKVVDLNAVVPEILSMLQRLLGENIDLSWRPATSLWPVMFDQSQLDQILTNLCVNARDAIGGTGTVHIATANRVIDAQFCTTHTYARPGNYVQLTVSDDGSGMTGDVADHIFEPFFTTKGVGEGTGLGLATVYGIVKQNDGLVTVDSAPGEGTTFDIYLPWYAGEIKPAATPMPSVPLLRGHETVLVVEDEPSVLQMTRQALEAQGYRVICANGPAEAMRLAAEHTGEIDLLLTDVMMPGMSGRELVDTLVPNNARLKYLLMSGFSEHASLGHESVADGVHFIAKPFTIAGLTARVRLELDRA